MMNRVVCYERCVDVRHVERLDDYHFVVLAIREFKDALPVHASFPLHAIIVDEPKSLADFPSLDLKSRNDDEINARRTLGYCSCSRPLSRFALDGSYIG